MSTIIQRTNPDPIKHGRGANWRCCVCGNAKAEWADAKVCAIEDVAERSGRIEYERTLGGHRTYAELVPDCVDGTWPVRCIEDGCEWHEDHETNGAALMAGTRHNDETKEN